MKDLPEIFEELKDLENLRGGVPTFIYFGTIGGRNLVRTRKILMTAPKEPEIDIILESSGGQADDAYRLIRTFREKYTTVNIIIPFWAKSAATLFAFGANRLVIHKFGELGPIDAQIKKDVETNPEGEWSSALNVQASLLQIEERSREGMLEIFNRLRLKTKDNEEILKIGRRQLAEMLLDYSAKFYAPLLQKIETIELGTMGRSLQVGIMGAKRILKQYTRTEDEKIEKLIEFLVYDCPNHGYVVDYDVLSSYLPHVIRPEEDPFGEEYNKNLEKLSVHLMLADNDDDDVVGFLRDFTSKNGSTIIKENDAQQQNKQQSGSAGEVQADNSGGLDDQSGQDSGQEDSQGSNQGA